MSNQSIFFVVLLVLLVVVNIGYHQFILRRLRRKGPWPTLTRQQIMDTDKTLRGLAGMGSAEEEERRSRARPNMGGGSAGA